MAQQSHGELHSGRPPFRLLCFLRWGAARGGPRGASKDAPCPRSSATTTRAAPRTAQATATP
eukprot:480809-Pyramimonas_sp.AAC.1